MLMQGRKLKSMAVLCHVAHRVSKNRETSYSTLSTPASLDARILYAIAPNSVKQNKSNRILVVSVRVADSIG